MHHRKILQESLDYIEDNLKTDITPEELADMAGFSLYHYYRLFLAATGFPVMQYILRRRLRHGIYAMAQGSSGIEAALTYGFDTYAGFYRAFQREFGATPSSFLRQNRAKRPWPICLYKEEHKMLSKKKAAEILKHWNLESEILTEIYNPETGAKMDNAWYAGEKYVLKNTVSFDKVKNQISLSRAMETAGLATAARIPLETGQDYLVEEGRYFYLTRRLPGTRLPAGKLTQEEARFVGEILGQLHQALSTVEIGVGEGDLLGTVQNWALPKAKSILNLDPQVCKHFLDTFGALYPRLPRQIIHRDPNPSNILRWEDKWGFVDFELSERNARIFDPCYAATAVLSECFGKKPLDSWLNIYRQILLGYDSIGKLTEEEWQAVPYVVLANQFVCVAWFAEEEKYADLLEINKQMTHWLIAHMEDLKLDNPG